RRPRRRGGSRRDSDDAEREEEDEEEREGGEPQEGSGLGVVERFQLGDPAVGLGPDGGSLEAERRDVHARLRGAAPELAHGVSGINGSSHLLLPERDHGWRGRPVTPVASFLVFDGVSYTSRMAWVKIPREHHPIFYAALPKDKRVETMLMFGGVAARVNG